MLRLSFLPKAVFPLAFLFLFGQQVFSQESRPFRYSDEIGIGFSPILRGQTGVSLLYKYALRKSTDVERRKRYALRVLLGYYDEPYNSSSFRKVVADTIFLIEGSGQSMHRFINTGMELQTLKKNFRFYVGADLGYRYWTSASESQYISQVKDVRFITEEFDYKSKNNVVQASILVGVNYFFTPRFSVGLEANFSAALEFSNSKLLQAGSVVRNDKGTLLEMETRLWRLLYMSYHFGGARKKSDQIQK
ncbi:MAG: hypothetical protein Q7T20_04660 [Saprospiraceae bacterium]|nr:hypothetical protein [Saprospiraceae bacterium]